MKQYPRSTWVNDARALEIEIRGASGQATASAPDGDDDLKLYAINGLVNMDPERAVPLLEQVLSGSQSVKIKERALFVLSQSSSTRAQDLMAKIARGQVQPELQAKAIHNLGISGKKTLLSDIYAAAGSTETRRAALKAMGHNIRVLPGWGSLGHMQAIRVDPSTGTMMAAGDPRRTAYAMGY